MESKNSIMKLIVYLVPNLIDANPAMVMHGVPWEVGYPVELISNVIWTAHSNSLIRNRLENQNQKSFIQRMYREYIDDMIIHVHAK